QRAHQLVADVVDLDRREPQARQPRSRAGRAHELRKREARLAVAVAAEVDPGQNDFLVTLLYAPPHLGEHALGPAAARGPAHERDDAERAREAAAVLHLDEGANA